MTVGVVLRPCGTKCELNISFFPFLQDSRHEMTLIRGVSSIRALQGIQIDRRFRQSETIAPAGLGVAFVVVCR